MKAVILAAGASKRLHPATVDLPKCLLDINGSTLLDHQLRTLESLDIREITLVVGFKQEAIKSVIKERWSSLNIRYSENPDFANTNTIYSLWLARDFLKDGFLYFNADVLCHKDVVKRLIDSEHDTCLAIDIKDCDEEEVKVILDDEKRVLHIGKDISIKDAVGEYIGVSKHGGASNALFLKKLNEYVHAGKKNLYFESALKDVVKSNAAYTVDISDLPFIEIDFPEDLETARNVVAKELFG